MLLSIKVVSRHSRKKQQLETLRHSRAGGNLELLNFQTAFEYCRCPTFWIPACAGMTVEDDAV
ncbi:TPA: hypothetical protein ACKN6Y_001951, partial [Neisseria gonorrhoeae]|nr:hypothetical protein [Neisseria gonorrhoeae]